MKRLIFIIILSVLTACAYAQPRAMGLRVGATGLEASYEHSMSPVQFIQGDLGMDFGYNVNGRPGVRATAVYNFIWARPNWTTQGSWAIYAGPGLSLGFVDDQVPYEIGNAIIGHYDNGFMIGVVGQVGVEYTFRFPLQLALEVRPCFGLHVNDGKFRDHETGLTVNYGGKTGFYDNGLLGFVPSLSIRYCF
ncbi:MAG: hypothetical protein IJB05_04545 [Bacteroidales bacterium]|nr:hypothetical protein [Bacteroidales bacterium]